MTHFKLKRCTNAPAHRATISIRHAAYSAYSEHEQFYMHMTTCNRGAKRTATLESEHKKSNGTRCGTERTNKDHERTQGKISAIP